MTVCETCQHDSLNVMCNLMTDPNLDLEQNDRQQAKAVQQQSYKDPVGTPPGSILARDHELEAKTFLCPIALLAQS